MMEFIESGILEAYITGATTPEEENIVLYMTAEYPEVKQALRELETHMEELGSRMAVTPPPGTWDQIEEQISGLMLRNESLPKPNSYYYQQPNGQYEREQYIRVETENNYIRVHKTWKWAFAAVFVLGKIFLICAIYFYLENRQAQQQIHALKTELQTIKGR
jgi:hypothetical protein